MSLLHPRREYMQPPQELRIFRQLMDRLLPTPIENVPFVEDEEDDDDY